MRRLGLLLFIVPLLWATPARAQSILLSPSTKSYATAADGTVVIGVTEDVFHRFLVQRPSPVGLGVYPPSRSPRAFLREVEAPPCVRIDVAASGSARAHPASGVRELFGDDAVSPCRGRTSAQPPPVFHVRVASSAREVLAFAQQYRVAWVIAVGERTPIWIATTAGDAGVLTGGEARRDGVITPSDLSKGLVPGRALIAFGVEPVERPVARMTALRARMERDDSYGVGLTCATVGFGLAGIIGFVLFRGRRDVASAIVRATAMVPAGYLVGMFVPSESWVVRSIALIAAIAYGVLAGADVRTFVVRAFVGTAAVLAALTLLAAMRPNAEPALSLWADPATSWRFFGLRNHLAAFLAGGAIVGVALARARPTVYTWAGLAAIAITGLPSLGAQFIGVFTLTLGLVATLLVLVRARPEIWHLPVAAVAALGVTLLAFLSDISAPISHGGRAAQAIRADGLGAAWDIFVERARLNYREIIDVPLPGAGVIGFIGVVIVLSALVAWVYRAGDTPLAFRAAILGGAAAAFVALFVEDSGFYTGSILGLYPALAYQVWSLERRQPSVDVVA